MIDHFWLALAWIGYFAIHSLTASLWLKRRVVVAAPRLMPAYRLLFNGLAGLLIVPLAWFMYSLHGEWLWRWQGVGFLVANGLALAAVAGFVWSLRWYDGQEFLGLRQLREGVTAAEDQESFHLSPLHHYVRHPWYSLGLVIVWSRDMDPAFLLSALFITVYFVLGSRLEERKLIAYHGEVYRRYRERVPSLIPWKGRALSAEEADSLRKLRTARSRPPPAPA